MDFTEIINGLSSAISGSEWLIVAAFVVLGVVQLAKKFAKNIVPWFSEGFGAFTLTMICGTLAALANSVISGAHLTFAVLMQGVIIGLGATGLYKGKSYITESESEK